MNAIIIALIIGIIILFLFAKAREQSKEDVIAQLEALLGAKASITRARKIYLYSFTIKGNYKERDVILSVIYGDVFTLRHSELCEVTVNVLLIPSQKAKYGCGRGRAKLSEVLKGIFGMTFSRIHVGALEIRQMFILGSILPPTYSRIRRLIDIAVNKAQKL